MLLYTFTTEGGSREDGNVYYADNIIVDAPESEARKVNTILKDYIGLDERLFLDLSDVEDEESDERGDKFHDTSKIIKVLQEAGYSAIIPKSRFVTLDRS